MLYYTDNEELRSFAQEVKNMERKKFYITTPIYYPSDKLHIGHSYCTCLLYTSDAADEL